MLDLYLARPSYLIGGFVCLLIGLLLSGGGDKAGSKVLMVVGGVFGFAGVIGVIMSFGGRSAPTVQFILVCVTFITAGIILFRNSKMLGKAAGIAIALLGAFALFNSTIVKLDVPFLDSKTANQVKSVFKETDKQFKRVFEEAQKHDTRSRQR